MVSILTLSDAQVVALSSTPGKNVILWKDTPPVVADKKELWCMEKVRHFFLALYAEKKRFFELTDAHLIYDDTLLHVYQGRLAERADPDIPLTEWLLFKRMYPSFWKFCTDMPADDDHEQVQIFLKLFEELKAVSNDDEKINQNPM